MKHYAYYNMSRRTQLTTKYLFQVLAQLTENFIFIYLGLSLFTEASLEFKPLFILVTVLGICVARWAAVFPLSLAINWVIRYRAHRRGEEVADELPYAYQAMLFWAGLRGAVGVALAAGLTGENGYALRATVLVVVVLTVIIFGGTTARMLEILGIRIGVDEEMDSDDEFDIENVHGGSTYPKRASRATTEGSRRPKTRGLSLPRVDGHGNGLAEPGGPGGYSSGNASSPTHPNNRTAPRPSSTRGIGEGDPSQRSLLARGGNDGVGDDVDDDEVGSDTSDLPPPPPPARRRSPRPDSSRSSPKSVSDPTRGSEAPHPHDGGLSARHALSQLLSGTSEDQAALFRQLDENFIKPKLLLDPGRGGGGGGSGD